jgi:hypothetical protein
MPDSLNMLEDLSTLPFAEVFRDISAKRLSGDLQVRSGRTAKIVFFDRGALVFAASNLKKDRLGEALVAVGRISERQFDDLTALMRQRDRRRRIGDALEESGLLDAKEVGRAVAMQVQRIVLSLFGQTDGVASFEERPCVIPPEYMIGLSVHGLLYRGIKSMRSAPLIRIGIGNLERKVVMVAVPPFRFSAERASREEQEILECAQTPARLGKLVSSGGRIVPTRLRAGYALCASGVLRDADPSGEDTQPVVHVDDRDFVLTSREPEPGPGIAPVAAIASGVSLAAVPEEPAGAAAAAGAAPPAGAARAAGAAPAAGELASSPTTTLPATPPPTQAARGETEVQKEVQESIAESERQKESEEQAVIDELLGQAKLHASIKNYPELIKINAKLIQLAPRNAAFRVQLGKAMTALPQTIKRAERQYLEAVRLEPNDAEIRFAFGRYYLRIKHKGRAREQFRLALSLDPRHERAHAALQSLAPKDSALDNIKKLFNR